MSNRNSKLAARVLAMSLAAAAGVLAQPRPSMPATGNGSVAGVVTNSASGAPLQGAHVVLLLFSNGPAQNFSTVTDAEGKFTFERLPSGRLVLNADHVGFVASPAGNPLSDSQLQPDEKKQDMRLVLTPTGAISGRVLNAEGGPVQGAIVSLDAAPFGINPATSDEKGQFRISGVPPGRYRVSANPAVLPFPPEIRTDGTNEVHYARTYYPDALTMKAGHRVEVGAGAEVMGIDIRLVRTPIVTLSGRVLDLPAGGKTVVRALASAATGGGVWMANNVKADGSFQIWQLDPGDYTVVATSTPQGSGQPGGLQSTPVELEVAGLDIENIQLRMIQPFDVSAQLSFDDAKAREVPVMQVRQGPGQPPPGQGTPGQPVPRRVMLRPEGQTFVNLGPSNQPIEIGPEDTFTMERLQPGRFRSLPLWGVYVKSVTVGATETEGDVLDLRNGPAGAVKVTVGSVTGEVSGVVSDSRGLAAGVRVVLMADRSRGSVPMFATSSGDGTYKFGAVPPGKYKLIAGDNEIVMQFQPGRDAEEYAELTDSIEIHAGDKVTKALNKQVSGGK